jgi:hypothetical protein
MKARITALMAVPVVIALSVAQLVCSAPLAPAGATVRQTRVAHPFNDTDGSTSPDPFVIYDGTRYYSFSTAGEGSNVNEFYQTCGGSSVRMWAPHRSKTALGAGWPNSCYADVMPAGPGAWAKQDVLWAPSVAPSIANPGTFLLYYAAESTSNQMCIAVATASSITGPYTPPASPLTCGTTGFAIDPNTYIYNNNLWLQWRDGNAPNPVSIKGAKMTTNGLAFNSSVRTLVGTGQITWEGGTVENPAMVKFGSDFWLTFSGSLWSSGDYATGFANCGTTPTTGNACSFASTGTTQPWWGYSGRTGAPPLQITADDHPGTGSLSFVSKTAHSANTQAIVTDSGNEPYVAMSWYEAPVIAPGGYLRPEVLYLMPASGLGNLLNWG